MARFADSVLFTPTAGGTTDWVVSAAVQGYNTPALAGMVNGGTYKYRAESSDLSQWEIGEGVYTSGTTTLTRATVLFNSSGTGTATGQSGAGTKINFTAAPTVGIVGLREDALAIDEANSFSSAQQLQARTNILAAGSLRTRTVLTSGSGTYTTPTNCKAINVRMCGGGGGGAGGDVGGTAGGTGGTTTFGTSLLSAGGGGGGGTFGNAPASGGNASGGDINLSGGSGMAWGPGAASSVVQGGTGAAGPFGGAGYGGWPSGGTAAAGAANTGAGGGGGGAAGGGHGGNSGAAGGYCEKLITSPSATYSYAVGAGGTAGGAGGSGASGGGTGGSGIIIIDEFY